MSTSSNVPTDKPPILIKPIHTIPNPSVSLFTLSNNDQIMPRVYTRILFFYGPAVSYPFTEITTAFSSAVSLLLNHDYAHLFGRLRSDDRGRLAIYPSNDGVPIYIQERTDIDVSTSNWTHEETPSGLITSSPLPHSMDDPIVRFHLTLLKHNYTCVGVTLHHAVMDGTGTFDFMQRLSTICRQRIINNNVSDSDNQHNDNMMNTADSIISPPSFAAHDRSPLLYSSTSSTVPSPLYPHQEYKIVKPVPPSPDSPSSIPPPFIMPTMKSYLFLLTTDDAEQLKQKAVDVIDASAPPAAVSRISTNDAITALIWRCVTRARRIDTAPTMVGIATNGRSRIDPPLPSSYSGNANFYATSLALTGTELMNESLHSTAVRIRTAVETMTSQYIRSSIAFLEAVENITWVFPGFNSFCGNDFAITDWSRFPLYLIDFGWSGVPLKVRLPGGNWDGLAVLFPLNGNRDETNTEYHSGTKQGRGLEIYLGLKEEHMNILCNDTEWLMYMKKVGEKSN